MCAGLSVLALVVLTTTPPLEKGRRLYEAMEFKAAERVLRQVNPENLEAQERRDACDLLARSLLAQNREKEAEAAYAVLLRTDPNAALARATPRKALRAFTNAK